jgi:probable rRNA maturation factor
MKPHQATRQRALPARHAPCTVINRQKRVNVDAAGLRRFARTLHAQLGLGQRRFDVTLIESSEMKRLNRLFRGQPEATDVLSFPWHQEESIDPSGLIGQIDLCNFLGDIVISTEIALRNAAEDGCTVDVEIRHLMLHGLLHLLGYDHEHDGGEMAELELSLRRELKIEQDFIHSR